MTQQRLDGASGLRISCRLARPLMMPGLMMTLLPGAVAVWDSCFLPLIILGKNHCLTACIGLVTQRARNGGNDQLLPVMIGGLVTAVPLITLCLLLHRHWPGGLALGRHRRRRPGPARARAGSPAGRRRAGLARGHAGR